MRATELPGPPPDEQGDAIDVQAMRRRHLRSVLRIERDSVHRPWSLGLFLNELSMPTTRTYLVARRQGPVVGFGGMLFSGPDGHVTTLAVHAEHRRVGVASRLLAALALDAINRGCENLTLEVRASNDAAFGLYEQFGFVRAGVRKNYYADLGEDAVVMWARDIQEPPFLQRLRAVDDRSEAG